MSISRVAVVGAGIVGLAIAREITRRLPEAEVTVFDKSDRIAAGQSGRTSGIVHAGLAEVPDSPGATLIRRGVELLVPFVAERGIPYRECGQMIIAQDTAEADRLEEMLARAETMGIPGVRLLDRQAMREIEPHARGVLALYSPHTAITDFSALAEALASDVRAAGATFRLDTEVTGIDGMANEVRIRVRSTAPTGATDGESARSAAAGGGSARADAAGGKPSRGSDDDGPSSNNVSSESDGELEHESMARRAEDSWTSVSGPVSEPDASHEPIHEVPRTYRGNEADPVVNVGEDFKDRLGEELRTRFGDKDWFAQAEKKFDEWTGKKPNSGGTTASSTEAKEGSGDGEAARSAKGSASPTEETSRPTEETSRPAEETAGTFDLVIVCVGVQADRLATASGFSADPKIVPFTSDYSVISQPAAEVVHGIISSVADPKAPLQETMVARTVNGSLLLGPNTYPALARENHDKAEVDFGDIGSTLGFKGFWKFASQNVRAATLGARNSISKGAFIENVQRFVPDIDAETVVPGPRGIRAQAISASGELLNTLEVSTRGRVTQVRNVPQSGATSALAIAEQIVAELVDGSGSDQKDPNEPTD